MVATDTATDSSLDSDNHNQGAGHGPVVATTLDRRRAVMVGRDLVLISTKLQILDHPIGHRCMPMETSSTVP